MEKKISKRHCYICEKTSKEARLLLTMDTTDDVFICDLCVNLLAETIEEHDRKSREAFEREYARNNRPARKMVSFEEYKKKKSKI